MSKFFKYFLGLLLATGAAQLVAQEIQVAAMLDTAKIRIGEHARIDLYITHKSDRKNLKIQWPRISDTLRKEIEVINVSKIDTTIPDKSKPGEVQEHQRITITSIDSGFWAIEPFVFIVNNDTARPHYTQPLLLEVQTVPVDTAEASIRDIKTALEEPFDWREYLPYVYWALAALAAVTIVVLLIYRYGRRTEQVVEQKKPKVPPHIAALASLEAIRRRKLWQEGKYKEYHTLISDAIRTYLEGRYGITAMELTSEEIFKIMNSQVIDGLSKEKLRQILTLADFVKFAKVTPIEAENELSLSNAFDFVNGTRREEEMILDPGTNTIKPVSS